MFGSIDGRILIIDDDLSRKPLRDRLSGEGFICLEAGSSSEALEQFHSNKPDLVLLSLEVCGPGSGLIQEMVGHDPDLSLIATARSAEPQQVVECFRQGVKDFILKPLDLERLVIRISGMLRENAAKALARQTRVRLETLVDEQQEEIRNLFLKTIESLVNALEAKDKYTAGHSQRVADYSLFIGGSLGLQREAMDNLCWAALLHDIGKIAVNPEIQNKPGNLTRDEYRQIMTHAAIGPDIVRPVVSSAVSDAIAHHHDHFDGSGLEQSLAGEDIPLGARIIAVADAFDAMTSDRPYRKALPPVLAMEELIRCSGTSFDPKLVSCFRQKMAEARII
jgi:cyclic di-GMP phosphodiesterase